jgi:hypothetical protein
MMGAILFYVLLALTGPAGDGHRWGSYENPRYGTQLAYPADLFGRGVESANGDGITLRAVDGATLAVFGANNVNDDTPARYVEGLVGDGHRYARLSYRLVRPGFAVLSGVSGGRVFYERYAFARGGAIHAFVLEYPLATRARYDGLVARMSASLR